MTVVPIIFILLFAPQDYALRLKWAVRPNDIRSATNVQVYPKTPVELAEQYGYKAETHNVTTSDGYILNLHRVQNQSVAPREPFILQHGLSINSAQWVVLEPSQSLATMLADSGYDVWLTNVRGNTYARNHKTLSPESAEFWNYSWHEHGIIDMPAMIDYILAATRHRQLLYAGHSMGTTMFFVMMSMRPEYNAKVKHMFALAPVAYCGNMKSSMRVFAPDIRTYQRLLKSTLNDHLPAEFIAFQLGKIGFCRASISTCSSIIDSIGGFNPKSNLTLLEAMVEYFPDAVSAGQVAHYAQQVNNPGTFRSFDYYEGNKKKYGNNTPPEYPVHKIKVPMTFFYSKNDYLTAGPDVEKFSRLLQNVRLLLVQDPQFNHFDYIISSQAYELVYNHIVKIANSYRAKSQEVKP